MKKLAVALVLVAVAFPGPGRAQGRTDPTLDRLAKEFAAAFNAKDAAKVASFYTEDAELIPPDEPTVKGRANIEACFRRNFDGGVTSLQLQPTESALAGTQAFEAGTSTVTIRGDTGPQTVTGRYLAVFKRVGSDWKIAYDIFSVDPSPAAPTK